MVKGMNKQIHLQKSQWDLITQRIPDFREGYLIHRWSQDIDYIPHDIKELISYPCPSLCY